MTLLSIGRVFDGLDVAPWTLQQSGRLLQLAGPVQASSYDQLRAVRERFEALTDNRDELAVPVTFTGTGSDASIAGWYEVERATWQQTEVSPWNFYATWSVELKRLGDQAAAQQLEMTSVHSVRTNQNSIDTTDFSGTDGWRDWLPGSVVDWDSGAYGTTSSRTCEGGTLIGLPYSAAGEYNVVHSLEPGDAYEGACSVRCLYGATAELVGGRGGAGAFSAGGWVLSNGLVRVKQHSSIASAFVVEVYDSGAWVTMHSGVGWRNEIDYGGGSVASWDLDVAPVVVLRNSPDLCAIRLILSSPTYAALFGRAWLDLTVRRGDHHVCGVFRVDTRGSLGGVLALEPTSSIAATTISSPAGQRATSNDSNGNRAVWGCAGARAVTLNTTTGRIVQNDAFGGTTGRELPFCVGVELGGSGATGADTATNVLLQWYDGRGTDLQPVRR